MSNLYRQENVLKRTILILLGLVLAITALPMGGISCISKQLVTPQEIAEQFVYLRTMDKLLSPYDKEVSAGRLSQQFRDSITVEISNMQSTLVSQTADCSVVEITCHVRMHIEEQRIQATGDIPDAYVIIAPQTWNWDLHQTTELIRVNGRWAIDNLFDGPSDAKLQTEFAYLQQAVSTMMEYVGTSVLDSAYAGVDTEIEATGVTSGGGKCNLPQFYKPFRYPYAQSYDITNDGRVAIH